MNNKKYVLAGFTICGVIFYGVSLHINTQQEEYVSKMKLLIAEQETTLTALAEVTDRNGADSVVNAIIKDCDTEDRQRFDKLLGTLGELPRTQLIEVDQLFNACGNFYAGTKSLMTARLQREYEVYAEYVALLDIVDSKADTVSYPVAQWSELVALEGKRSELSSKLVEIQKEIIQALLDGVSLQSDQMSQEVRKAQEVQDTLSYTGVKIDTLREGILQL